MVMMPRRSWEGGVSGDLGGRRGKWAYEEADDPGFDDGEVRGEDGEPRHGGRGGHVAFSSWVWKRCCGV